MKLSRTQKEILENQLKNEKEIIQNIKAAYREALEQIDNRIIQLQVQIGDIQRSDKTDTVISSMIQSKIYQKQYQQALKDQVSGILDQLNGSQFNSINEYLTKCYTDGYISTMYDLTSRGIPIIMPIDQKAVVQALSTNSKLSKSLYESLGENIKNMKKKVVAEIARGIASSLPYAEIARNISGRSNAGMNNSIRIARTEGQRIRNTASYEAQVKAKEKGADIVKQWCATLDGRTRGSHRHLDGKIVEIDEKFKIGNKSAMFPGDFGDPAEDCNCRCCILQRAKWDLDEAELNTLKKRAEYYGLDKTESFDDFRTKYLYAQETEHNTDKPAILDKNIKSDKIDLQEVIRLKNGSETNKYFKVQSDYLKNEASPDIKENLRWYSVNGYSNINGMLRGTLKVDKETRKNVSDFRKVINNYIDKTELNDNIITYRTMERSALEKSIGKSEDIVGKIFTDKGYMSTSPVEKVVDKFSKSLDNPVKLEITVPKGKGKGAYINEASVYRNSEYEFLLKENTSCRITEVVEIKGQTVLRMEVIE